MSNETTLDDVLDAALAKIEHWPSGAYAYPSDLGGEAVSLLAKHGPAIKAALEDARRYRWLRERGSCPVKGSGRWCEPSVAFTTIYEMDVREHDKDACIDAAIDAAQEVGRD